MDVSNPVEPPCNLDQALNDVFPGKPCVVHRLLRLLGPLATLYRPLNLNACEETTAGILAYAKPSDSRPRDNETWNPRYTAYTYRADSTGPTSSERVTFMRGLLVGFIGSDSNGSILISGTCWNIHCRLLIAPSADPAIRGTPVWIRDWRYFSSSCGLGIFEVLAKDIVVLTTLTQAIPRLRVTELGDVLSRFSGNVRGFLRAKSCIIASKSPKPCFLVELAELRNVDDCASVTVAFCGRETIRWWPFLDVGQDVVITGLKVSRLPRYGSRLVLKAQSPSSSCFSPQRVNQSRAGGIDMSDGVYANGLKKRRIDGGDAQALKLLNQATELINYEGEVSTVLGVGKFEMDGKAILFLGEFHGSCVGRGVADICFRKGAKISASCISYAFRSGRLYLFPTGRTSFQVRYFGEVSDHPRGTNTKNSAWRWIWKRWNFGDIIWADEVYCAFKTKFGSWLREDQVDGIVKEPLEVDLIRYLLGTRTSTGLVQFAMSLLSDRPDITDTELGPSRDLYKEFLCPDRHVDITCARPCTPSLRSVCEAIQLLWRQHASRCQGDEEGGVLESCPSQLQVTFQDLQIMEALYAGQHEDTVLDLGQRGESLALLGLLQGSWDRNMVLSDSSASVSMRAVGHLPLESLGSLVAVRQFWAVAEATPLASSCHITLLFYGSSVQEVVSTSLGSAPRSIDVKTSSRVVMSSTFHTAHSLSGKPRITVSQEMGIRNDAAAEIPLVCILVERLSPGTDFFGISGYLVAVCRSPREDRWIALGSGDAIFCSCTLTLSGQFFRSLGAGLHVGGLYGISCTNLGMGSNPIHFLRSKIIESLHLKSPLKLSTSFEAGTPCVRNLRLGEDITFATTETPEIAGERGSDGALDGAGAERSSIVSKIKDLSTGIANGVIRALWRAFCFRQPMSKEQLFALRGTVYYCGHKPHMESSDDQPTLFQLSLRDEQVSAVRIHIEFFEPSSLPRGITAGMVVVVQNVSRVAVQNGLRFRFVGSKATFIDIVSVPSATQKENCSNCSALTSRLTIFRHFRHRALWEFGKWSEKHQRRSCEAGVVRVRILRVERIEVRRTKLVRCTQWKCSNTDGRLCAIAVALVATVDDGSSTATMSCKGLRLVMNLLEATVEERKALHAMARSDGDFEIGHDQARSSLNHQGHSASLRECVSITYQMMCRKRSGTVVALVMNQSPFPQRDSTIIKHEPEILMKNFQLGFGRMLWTAYSHANAVFIDCLAVCGSTAAVDDFAESMGRTETILKYLIDEPS